MTTAFDILVVGGGINGAAVARDAAGRGARVALVEQDDLASHTSSASSKLIHGGLRYLEQYEFRLVAKALAERERLMKAAPHLIRPLQFVLPRDRSMRPAWMMRVGLFLYDRLGGRSSLPGSRAVRLGSSGFGRPVKPEFGQGYLYWDCWGDDSRLVVANALDAQEHGAVVMPRTRCVKARREQTGWTVELDDERGVRSKVTAAALVNATGSWAGDFLPQVAGLAGGSSLRLVKGSHLVTRRLYDGDHAYILQNPDGRIVFAIPFERDFTLLGTTDVEWTGPRSRVAIDEDEIRYICDAVNRWFATPVGREDIVWSFAGLRPLYDDASATASEISRDYVLSVDDVDGRAPVLSVFGGKITTHRALAEEAMDKLARHLPSLAPAWTASAVLPGGDLGPEGIDGLAGELQHTLPFLGTETALRLAQSYGSRVWRMLRGVHAPEDLGRVFGAGLSEVEVDYLVREEWASTSEDVLWRRTKLGLHMRPDEIARFRSWFGTKFGYRVEEPGRQRSAV